MEKKQTKIMQKIIQFTKYCIKSVIYVSCISVKILALSLNENEQKRYHISPWYKKINKQLGTKSILPVIVNDLYLFGIV